jgi:L-iditol 2-dehydrogenase
VVLIGHHEDRLRRFEGGTLQHCLNAKQTPAADAVRDLLLEGIQVLVDTVGSIEAVEELLPLMQRHGHIVSAGFYGTEDRFALQPARRGELSVDLVSGWSRPRMDHTRALIAVGYLQTLPLITHRFPVQQAAEAWKLIASKREPVLGVILEW